MVELDGYRVIASNHAIEQALRRVPVLRGADEHGSRYWVEQTAARALRDGRRARRCPRWAVRGEGERGRTRSEGVHRYLWNEALTAAFVAQQMQDNQGRGKMWLIKTVLRPG